MVDRDDLTFGRSTLQGGDTTIIEKVVGDLSLPDLVLRDQPEFATPINSRPDPFGSVFDDGISPPSQVVGDRIFFGLRPIDRFSLGSYSGLYAQWSGLSLDSPKGIKEGDGPYDFSSGVFEFTATIETFANSVGERAICFVWSCFSLENLVGWDVILYAQSLVPTTAQVSIITLATPPIALDFADLQVKAEAFLRSVLAKRSRDLPTVSDWSSGVSLHFHQTSGEPIEITSATFSAKKTREVKDGEVKNYFES